jgi:hypothetical protein
MPSKPKPRRAQLRPAADFDQLIIPVTQQPPRVWFRVHKIGSPAVLFGNFSHHRFSHPDAPFPLLYLGGTIQTCLWEYFGDDIFQGKRAIAAGKWLGCIVSEIVVPEIRVCAVTLARTREAMSVDKASLLSATLTIPQAWGLAMQRHSAKFDAIKYSSRFLDQSCLALFDRAGMQSKLRAKTLGPLFSLDPAVDWLDEREASLV